MSTLMSHAKANFIQSIRQCVLWELILVIKIRVEEIGITNGQLSTQIKTSWQPKSKREEEEAATTEDVMG